MRLKATFLAGIDFCPDLKQICRKCFAKLQHFFNRWGGPLRRQPIVHHAGRIRRCVSVRIAVAFVIPVRAAAP